MRFNLTAILDDGTPLKPGLVADPRRTMNVQQGEDVVVSVSIVTPAGSPVDLSGAGTEALLTVKKNPRGPYDGWPRMVRKASLAGNVATFQIEAGATYGWLAGLYAWDVWLILDSTRTAIVPTSPFNLLQSVAAVPIRPPPPTLVLVENDTEPLLLDFSGVDISGWIIEAHVGYDAPLVKGAVITDALHGLAQVNWLVGDLRAGIWGGEIKITKPGPLSQTTEEYIFDIRPAIAGEAGANYLYYDTRAPGTYDAAFITGLANQPLVSVRTISFTIDALAGEYIYFALPVSFGTPVFSVNGFAGGFSQVATVSVTNLAGTNSYTLWRSDNIGLGVTLVEVT